MKRNVIAVSMCVLVFCVLAGSSFADGIIGTTGNVVIVGPPPDATQDQLESNSSIFVWVEQQIFQLPVPVTTNASVPGLYDSPADLSNAVLPAGAWVHSYYVHADFDSGAPGAGEGALLTGSLTFEEVILGVITTDGDLLAAHPVLGAAGTIYNDGFATGLDLNDKPRWDRFILSADMHTVDIVQFWVSTVRDSMRIVTYSVVPEPGTLALLAGGGLALVLRKRRR